MKWASLIWNFLFDAIKAFLGTDKPQVHEVKDAPAHPSTVDSDSKLIADLERLRSQYRTADQNGMGDNPSGPSSPSPEGKADSDAT